MLAKSALGVFRQSLPLYVTNRRKRPPSQAQRQFIHLANVINPDVAGVHNGNDLNINSALLTEQQHVEFFVEEIGADLGALDSLPKRCSLLLLAPPFEWWDNAKTNMTWGRKSSGVQSGFLVPEPYGATRDS
jgi:hypothetical protein